MFMGTHFPCSLKHMLGDSIHIEEFEQNQVVAISQGVTLEKGINTFMCLFWSFSAQREC